MLLLCCYAKGEKLNLFCWKLCFSCKTDCLRCVWEAAGCNPKPVMCVYCAAWGLVLHTAQAAVHELSDHLEDVSAHSHQQLEEEDGATNMAMALRTSRQDGFHRTALGCWGDGAQGALWEQLPAVGLKAVCMCHLPMVLTQADWAAYYCYPSLSLAQVTEVNVLDRKAFSMPLTQDWEREAKRC